MNGSRRRHDLTAEINVTSLVDVAFTLLIIFIITAPMMQGGIEVDLPEAEAQPLNSSDAVIITIAAEGSYFVDNVPASSLEELRLVYPRVAQEKSAETAFIKTDRVVPAGELMRVMGALMALDVTAVSLIVEPEPGR